MHATKPERLELNDCCEWKWKVVSLTFGANITTDPQSQVIQELNTFISKNTVAFWVHLEAQMKHCELLCFCICWPMPGNKTPFGKWGLPSLCSCAFPLCRPPLPHRAQSLPFNLPLKFSPKHRRTDLTDSHWKDHKKCTTQSFSALFSHCFPCQTLHPMLLGWLDSAQCVL